MEHFDDLLKKKMEGQTHRFHFSDWKSFCLKAGINPGIAASTIVAVVSVPVVVTSVIASLFYFTDTPQPVSTPTPEVSLQNNHIDTCTAEPVIILPDSVKMTVSTPTVSSVKREKPVKTETTTPPVIEQKPENYSPPREYIRKIKMRIDTIKSDNQLMDL
jgi:hypothetical protein